MDAERYMKREYRFKRKENRQGFFKLALPYLGIVFFPIVSIVVLSNVLWQNYHDQIVSEKQSRIETAFDNFLRDINEIETLAYAISRNDVMQYYAVEFNSITPHTLTERIELKNLLQSMLVNDNIKMIYYYDPDEKYIVSDRNAMHGLDDFFHYVYQVKGYSAEDFLETFSSGNGYTASFNAIVDNAPTLVMEYRLSMPIDALRGAKGYLALVIDAVPLFDEFAVLEDVRTGIQVCNKSDQILYESGDVYQGVLAEDSEKLSSLRKYGETGYGMTLQTYNSSWKIKIYLPELMTQKTMSKELFLFLGFSCFSICACIVMCIVFTSKNYRLIINVFNLFDKQKKEAETSVRDIGKGFEQIKVLMSQLLDENTIYFQKMMELENQRKQVVLERLIRNHYVDRESLRRELSEIETKIKNEKCILLCVRYESVLYRMQISKNETLKELFRDKIETVLTLDHEICDLSAREMVCIVNVNGVDDVENVIREMITKLKVEVSYYFEIEMRICAGGIVDSLEDISISYAQAKEVLSYCEASGEIIESYAELMRKQDLYFYPKDVNEKIYNYLFAGKSDDAINVVRTLYEKNVEKGEDRLSLKAKEELKARLSDLFVLISEKTGIGLDEQIKVFMQEKAIGRCFDILYRLMEELSEKLEEERSKEVRFSAKKIMEYVKENYADEDMSLKKISGEFGLTESYISNMFKACYEENISVLVERLRIEKASELIKNTNLKVGEIAVRVGYSSESSFRRAFKKIKGISPREYREA